MHSIQQLISSTTDQIRNAGSPRPEVTLSQHGSWFEQLTSMGNDSGVQVSEKTVLALSAVYRAVTLLAGSIASQPLHQFERFGEGMREKKLNRDHPAYLVLNRRPNGYMNDYQFRFYMVAIRLLWGNFYAYIQRNAFYEPVALHPIAPWLVDVKIEKGRKVYYVKGKRYTYNQIFHDYGLSLDMRKGVNPIKYNAQTLGLDLAVQKFQSSVFGKGTHAGGIMTMPEEEARKMNVMASTDEEADQYMGKVRESFRKAYQSGPDSWHNLMFLEPGWEFEQFKLNLETAQIIETRKFGVQDVARIFGVPLHKLMELDKATKDNIEQQGIEYVQDGVMPISKGIEAEADMKLLKESEKESHFFKHNLDYLQRGDLKSRYEAYSIALGKNAAGWKSPEEIRELEDDGTIDPEKLYKPKNMINQTEEEPEQNRGAA